MKYGELSGSLDYIQAIHFFQSCHSLQFRIAKKHGAYWCLTGFRQLLGESKSVVSCDQEWPLSSW